MLFNLMNRPYLMKPTLCSFSTLAVLLLTGALLPGCDNAAEAAKSDGPSPWTSPAYDAAFSEVWHDGRAEMAAYDLTYPRYGELRTGTAVAITVTEPFDPEKRVKAYAVGQDTYGVVKLNLAEDFQTGVYDYNLMTSVFVATEPANGLPAGSPTKVSFSSQEWCGHVYQQSLFSKPRRGQAGVETTWHSYFESEADRNNHRMDHPRGGIAEDALMLWARGLAGPALEPGQSVEVPIFRSLAVQRLGHVEPAWIDGTLTRTADSVEVQTPEAGTYTCDVMTAEVDGRSYQFFVNAAEGEDRQIIKVTRSDGYELVLRGIERLPYWGLNDNADERELEKFNVSRRTPGQM